MILCISCILSQNLLALYHTITTFNDPTLYKEPFENIIGKGENAGDQHFLLFPQRFLSFPKQISIFESFILSSANPFNLDQSKVLSFGKELKMQVVR